MLLFFPRHVVLYLLMFSIYLSGCAPVLDNFQKSFQDIFQTSEAVETKSSISCEKMNEAQLVFRKSTLRPRKVKRGQEITVSIVYEVACAPDSGVLVKEKMTLWHQGKELTVLTNENASRQNGTWESSITFRIPKSAQFGRYEVRQNMVSSKRIALSAASVFILSN